MNIEKSDPQHDKLDIEIYARYAAQTIDSIEVGVDYIKAMEEIAKKTQEC